ncbi:MAG TPA: hypothetical protein VIQ24_21200, partial [Pyrinomonadaceae bacterium]
MNRLFSKTLLNISMSILCFAAVTQAQESPALKVFPPASGTIRLENPFGDVEVTVWQESYIGFSTSVLPPDIKTSPLELERTGNTLRIKVSSKLSENQYPLALKVSVPVDSKLQISTNKGMININGLPSSLSVRS